jgi:hypothetical protein
MVGTCRHGRDRAEGSHCQGISRYAKGVGDYFLAHVVFPKEIKEFPHKLSASGWDIGQIKTHPTTGFSGTNDFRKVLPLSVEHLDLQEQKHTNATASKIR